MNLGNPGFRIIRADLTEDFGVNAAGRVSDHSVVLVAGQDDADWVGLALKRRVLLSAVPVHDHSPGVGVHKLAPFPIDENQAAQYAVIEYEVEAASGGFSFPGSAWERTDAKLSFVTPHCNAEYKQVVRSQRPRSSDTAAAA